jgi:DNA-binding MarR family transcriptional regulator
MKKINSNPEATKELYRLSVLMKQMDNSIQKAREAELRKSGITPEQAAALICIHSLGEKATSAEISRWLFRDESSMLVLIRRMIGQGLITKTADRNNKHLIRLELTPKGLSAYNDSIEFLSLYEIFSCLSDKKRQQLFSILNTLRTKAFNTIDLDPETYAGLFSDDLVLEKTEITHRNNEKH